MPIGRVLFSPILYLDSITIVPLHKVLEVSFDHMIFLKKAHETFRSEPPCFGNLSQRPEVFEQIVPKSLVFKN